MVDPLHQPVLRRKHGKMVLVHRDIFLKHTNASNGKNNVGDRSKLVVGSGSVGSLRVASPAPDLRHSPPGTTSTGDLKNPLHENSNNKEEALELEAVHGSRLEVVGVGGVHGCVGVVVRHEALDESITGNSENDVGDRSKLVVGSGSVGSSAVATKAPDL